MADKVEVERSCQTCGKRALKACASCRVVFYCSSVCQKIDWDLSHKGTCDKLFIITYYGKIKDVMGNQASFEYEETMGKREKRRLLRNDHNITNFMERLHTKYHDEKFALKPWHCACGNKAIGLFSRPINCVIMHDVAANRMTMNDLIITPCCGNLACVQTTITNMERIGQAIKQQMVDIRATKVNMNENEFI